MDITTQIQAAVVLVDMAICSAWNFIRIAAPAAFICLAMWCVLARRRGRG